ncbi:MAG: WD40 repeat domain-containing protein, partial [Acidobacteriota bacterium]
RAQLAAAQAAVEQGDRFAAARLLDGAPENLRGWEWQQLQSELDESLAHWRAKSGAPVGIAFDREDASVLVATQGGIARCSSFDEEPSWTWRAGDDEAVLAMSADGERVVLRRGGTSRLLTPATGESVLLDAELPEHAEFTRDGRRVWVLSRDETGTGVVIIADSRHGDVVGRERLWAGAGRASVVGSVLANPAIGRKGITIRDLSGGSRERTHEGPVLVGTFAGPRGGRLIGMTGGPAGRTVAFDLRDGSLLPWDDQGASLPDITKAAFSADESLLAIVHVDGTTRLLDGESGRDIAVVAQADSVATFAGPAVHGEAGLVAAVGGQQAIVVADASGVRRQSLRGHAHPIAHLRFSDDASLLASVDLAGHVRLWDLAGTEDTTLLSGHESYVYDVAIDPTGRRLATGAWDGTTRLWDLGTGRPIATLRAPGSLPFYGKLGWSPEGRWLVTVHGHEISLWDAWTGELRETRLFEDSVGAVSSESEPVGVDWHPACDVVVVSAVWRPIHAYRVTPDGALMEPETWPMLGEAVDFSPNGELLAVSMRGKVRLWDVASGTRLVEHDCSPAPKTRKLAFSPDGRRLAAVSDDGFLRTWSVDEGQELLKLQAHAVQAHGLAWSPDGSRIATGGSDRVLRIWDAVTGDELAMLSGHELYAYTLDWSPDGQVLVSGSGDATVRVWDARARSERLQARRERERLRATLLPMVKTAFETRDHVSKVMEGLWSRTDWTETERQLALDLVLELATTSSP